jgi:branched-chain amino acid transport system permease protein
MVSLGHAAFLGIAAYAYALLVGAYSLSPASAAIVTLFIGTAAAAVFGLIALRTSGLSFLMITLALGQIVWGIAFRYTDLTNGDNGLNLSPAQALVVDPFGLYFLCLAVVVISFGLIAVLFRSPLGAAIKGVRDQPRRMNTLGFDTWALRYLTYVLSGLFATVAGILYVQVFRFISPHALSLAVSSEAVLMVIAGGIGTLFGPLLGAGVVVLLKNVASAYTDRWPTLLGCIFLFIILAMPDGLLPGAKRVLRNFLRVFNIGTRDSSHLAETQRAK